MEKHLSAADSADSLVKVPPAVLFDRKLKCQTVLEFDRRGSLASSFLCPERHRDHCDLSGDRKMHLNNNTALLELENLSSVN